mgnify:CR=1 FL=1
MQLLCGLICTGDPALDALVESAYSIAIAVASSSFSLAATAAAAFALSRLAFFASSFATFFAFAASSAALSAASLLSTVTLDGVFRSRADVSSVSGGPFWLRKFRGIGKRPNLLCFAKTSSPCIEELESMDLSHLTIRSGMRWHRVMA